MTKVYQLRLSICSEDNKQVYFTNESEDQPTIEITLGEQEIFPKLEKMLSDMQKGQRDTVILQPDDAFGMRDEEAVVEIDIEKLPEDLRQVGMEVDFEVSPEHIVSGVVQNVGDENATIDFNHPLAGESVVIDFVVEDVAG